MNSLILRQHTQGTCELPETVAACMRPTQARQNPSTEKGSGHKPPPLWPVPPGKGKVIFLQQSHTRISTTLLGMSHAQKQHGPTQNKLYGLVCAFSFILVGFVFLGFIYFDFHLFKIYFIFFEKNRGREVEGTREELEWEEGIIKIYCMKTFFLNKGGNKAENVWTWYKLCLPLQPVFCIC